MEITPAQIEAAAKALENIWVAGVPNPAFKVMAKAALTAAEQVEGGEMTDIVERLHKTISSMLPFEDAAHKRLEAEALNEIERLRSIEKVGEPCVGDDKRTLNCINSDATIERCVQKLEEGPYLGSIIADFIKSKVAAIRKLKEGK